ncbi:ATP-dependent Clp protease proteolytic subunit [Oscillibacter sp.]|uniref:ClpP family protease n=1 Tax=Oscillibacter sp. TaxID=1945593 RepID=UPI003394A2D5
MTEETKTKKTTEDDDADTKSDQDTDKDNTDKGGTGPEEWQQQIVDSGSVTTKSKRGNLHCLTIIGQIEGHMTAATNIKATKYEHVMPLLAALEQSDEVDGVLFLLNTVGGDIEAGLGIAELIAGMSKPTASLVLGGSHSIGIPLAVSTKRSFAVPSAAMTIHPVRMSGTVIAAPQTYHYFERLQDRIVDFVTRNCAIDKDKFLSLMMKTGEMAADVGSVIYGEEAVRMGLIDQVGTLSDALNWLYDQLK